MYDTYSVKIHYNNRAGIYANEITDHGIVSADINQQCNAAKFVSTLPYVRKTQVVKWNGPTDLDIGKIVFTYQYGERVAD